MNKITIIMPSYNPNEQWFTEAVKSVVLQTYQDWKLVIINDGSQSIYDDLFNEIEKSDKRIKVIYHWKHFNQSTALNTGIKNSKSKYICFLDCDDIYNLNKLYEEFSYLENHKETDMVYGGGYYIDEEGNNLGEYKLNDNPNNLLNFNCICVGGVMIKRSVLKKVGKFDEKLDRSQDWDMWIRVLKGRFNIKKLEDNFIYYRIHDEQKSKKIDKKKSHNYIKKKHKLGDI